MKSRLLNLPLNQSYILLLVAAIPALLAAWLHPVQPDWNWREAELEPGMVSLSTLPAPVDEIVWIDARGRRAFEAGHIPGAILLNEDEWEALFFDAFDALIEPHPIVVYCDDRGCGASEAVAERLRSELAREDIYVLWGGWESWRER